MERILRKEAMKYELNKDDEPALRVKEEESFVIETEDVFSGYVRSEDKLLIPEHLPTRRFRSPRSNSMAGPIYLEGAKKGDPFVR